MATTSGPRSWQEMRDWQVELLQRRTGRSLESWNRQVRDEAPDSERGVRAWLGERGVTGYCQMLLVHERFGYPDFFTKTADELVETQYADRPELRPIYDAVTSILPQIGEVTIQTRKTYVSLSDAGTRLGSMVTVKVALHGLDDLDDEIIDWLRAAYNANL